MEDLWENNFEVGSIANGPIASATAWVMSNIHDEDTPPGSPKSIAEVDDLADIDEDDICEVYELDEVDDCEDDKCDEDDEMEGPPTTEVEVEEIPADDSILVFSKHTDGVLCSAFHPKLNHIVATGGVDDIAYVWNAETGEVIMTSKKHEDSVEMIAFSYDGKYLATGDLKGVINVWNTNDYSLTAEFCLDDDLSWASWHHGCNLLVGASEKGMIYMFKVSTGQSKMVMTPFGMNCLCGKIFPNGKLLVCGYSEGVIKIADLKQGTVVNSVKINEGVSGISAIDVYRDSNIIICGCENGDIVLVSAQAGKVLAYLNSVKASSKCNFVEAIAFCKDPLYNVAASGSLDGTLIIWDLTMQNIRHRTNFESGVNQLVWHPSQPLLYVCTTEVMVAIYDAKSGSILRELTGHSGIIYSLALSSDTTRLITTSEDKTARIYTSEVDNAT